MNTPVIEAKGLQKRYGRAMAVDGIDLSIGRGEVFGLLGPNGSGKTTTILMLLGLTEPTGGAVRVLSYDPLRQPLEVKRRVGYLPDSVGFYDHWSAAENLSYTARLAGIESAEARRRVDDSLARVGLAGFANRRTSTFSHGMRQRLGLAEILVKQPVVAILDEPTNGLDPSGREHILKLIGSLWRDLGISVVMCSHLLRDIERVCDRVMIIGHGRLLEHDSIAGLKARHRRIVEIAPAGEAERFQSVLTQAGLAVVKLSSGRLRVESAGDSIEWVLELMRAHHLPPAEIVSNPDALHELFIKSISADHG